MAEDRGWLIVARGLFIVTRWACWVSIARIMAGGFTRNDSPRSNQISVGSSAQQERSFQARMQDIRNTTGALEFWPPTACSASSQTGGKQQQACIFRTGPSAPPPRRPPIAHLILRDDVAASLAAHYVLALHAPHQPPSPPPARRRKKNPHRCCTQCSRPPRERTWRR